MLAALLAAFVVQCLAWAAVAAGLRRVREAAPEGAGAPGPGTGDGVGSLRSPTADGGPRTADSPRAADESRAPTEPLAASPVPPGEGQDEGDLTADRGPRTADSPLAAATPQATTERPEKSPSWTGLSRAKSREGDGGGRSADLGAVPELPTPAVPLSVVVAAHDEADRLPALLDALAAQTHRPFEVVVVDDRSTDRTAALVRWRMDGFPVPLRLVEVEAGAPEAAGLPPKKHALERGVEAAAHARVAFTDADGRPGPDWLATLARFAAPDGADDGAVLVGYGPYLREDGWLNRFVRYETVQTAALAAAGVGLGVPWQAVGRNFSYPTALLGRLGGFAHSARSLSGDDDLLLQEVARTGAADVRYVWSEAGAVPSPAPPDAAAFWRQKRRHASAGAHYAPAVLVGLGLFHVSNLALWVGAPALHLLTGLPYGWGLLAGKLLLQRSVWGDVLDGLGDEPDLRLWQPALDALAAGYHAVFAALGALPTPKRW